MGESVCSSGAFSGNRCSITVKDTNVTIEACDENGQNCKYFADQVQAERGDHTNAGGQGDSGGPVYLPLAEGANARGINTAIDPRNLTTCTGDTSGNRECSWRIWYGAVLDDLADFGYTITTYGGG